MSDRAWMAGGSLPAPLPVRLLEGRFADILLRPWFDRLALRAVVDWYFPLSRGWAAAIDARGSLDRYRAQGGVIIATAKRTESALARIEMRRQALADAEMRWAADFFGDPEPAKSTLVQTEIERLRAAHGLMAARSEFLPIRRRLPAVRWSVASVDAVAAAHELRRAGDEPPFPLSAGTGVTESRRVESALGQEYWLQFPSTVAGTSDIASAHVYEPANGHAATTIIFLHGIAMETEMWWPVADPVNALVARGIRVVRPEGPWHGRRRKPGFFGGEPVFATGALGFIDAFQAWVREIGALIRWARRKGSERIAIGGVSLGSLASQLAATAARDWPPDARPDALFLLVTTGDVATAAVRGGMARRLKVLQRLAEAGWQNDEFLRWRTLVEPSGSAAVAPERIVMVLGETDDVTPFAGGLALARNWRVPPENLFIRHGGHFSTALGIYRDRTPLDRLVAVLA